MLQLYLIISSDAKWVTDKREEIVRGLVSDEMRDENLLELFATNNRGLRLSEVLPEVLAELSTIPFLPDSRRVVVLHDLLDLYQGSRGRKKPKTKQQKSASKSSPVDMLEHFIKQDLTATENVLVISNIIDFEKGQQFDEKGKLARLFMPPLGRVEKPRFRETDPVFLMGNALMERNAMLSVRHFRSIYNDRNRFRIFSELQRTCRLLLQAKLLQKMEAQGISRENIETSYVPSDKKQNFYKQASFVQNKVNEAIGRFQLRELMQAQERLLELNRWVIPNDKDTYVPDFAIQAETFIVEFCQGVYAQRTG